MNVSRSYKYFYKVLLPNELILNPDLTKQQTTNKKTNEN